jgi:hypothetical protein
MPTITLRPGKLNNRQDPIKLGKIEDWRNPVIDTLIVAQDVDFDNNGLTTVRAGRTRRLVATSPHSFWVHPADSALGFFVEGGVLKRLNVGWTATTIATLSTNLPLSYEVVNGEVVVSNGSDIGWLSATEFLPFAPSLGQFELAMPAGQYLAFDHGDNALLVAAGSTVFRSKPYNIERREQRLSAYPMNGYIRMLACVGDGWYVATDKHVSFVQRSGAEELVFQHVTDAAPPDGGFSAGWEEDEKGVRRVVRWISQEGFCRGYAGGRYENLSYPDVATPTGTSGRVFHRVLNGIDQYVAVVRGPENRNAFTAPTIALNSITVS